MRPGGEQRLACGLLVRAAFEHDGAARRLIHNVKYRGVAAAAEPGLEEWVGRNVSFPNTMVDRITPATTAADRDFLVDQFGLIDRWPVVAEPFMQWVIEDSFAKGRPPWEDAGALFTSDVEPYEILKLRLLNAGHSCLAYLAALAGHVHVHDVMADRAFGVFLQRFGHGGMGDHIGHGKSAAGP